MYITPEAGAFIICAVEVLIICAPLALYAYRPGKDKEDERL